MRNARSAMILCLLLAGGALGAQQAKPTAQRQPSSAPEYWPLGWGALSGFYVDPYVSPAAAEKLIPKHVWNLDSAKVILSGYVIPFDFNGAHITQFALTESLDACGYGENLTPTNWVAVQMKPGKTAPYSQSSTIQVFGTLVIGAVWDGGQLSSLYLLKADSARWDQ